MMNTDKTVNIVLLGAPGAGKGTQAEILVDAYKFLHISTGDMLRTAVKEGTELGKTLEDYMNRGALVPDDIVTKVVIERMSKPDAQSGVMLDGYPRTCKQAESLEKSLKEAGKKLDMVLYLKITEETAVQRLCGRRGCKSCGKIYHVVNMPPKVDGKCDECGGELFQRDDDKPGTVKNRLKVYEESTKDLVAFYTDRGLLKEMDASGDARDLFDEITLLFKEKGLI